MGKGAAAERELSDTLEDEYHFAAMPAGGSGSGTGRARPDVMAARRPRAGVPGSSGAVAVFEVKAWADATGHLDAAEIEALRDFASRAGGRPYVAVRPDRRQFDGWHVYRVQALHATPGGHYSIRQADRPGRSLQEVFGSDE